MLALLQRVVAARVEVAGDTVGAIERGLLVFVCAEPEDDEALADRLVARILKLRLFADAAGKMNRSVVDVGGGLLIVSQFTLAADLSSGNRPGFSRAASPALGHRLYERVVLAARASHHPVQAGVFGADMQVHLVNDGPVTIPLTLRG
jgi:D-aminoacyl-tRNA deacylase